MRVSAVGMRVRDDAMRVSGDVMRVSAIVVSVVGLVVAGMPGTAAAHAQRVAAPSHVPVVVLLAAAAWLYARGVRRLGRRWPRSRIAATAAGVAVIAVALLSPLDALAASSITAHMAQHTLLILVAAPLLALGRPFAVAGAALPRWPRAGRMLGAPRPGLACATHALALWLWHLPPLYDVALERAWVHALAHATLLGTATLLWSSVTRGRARITGALWLFVTAFHAGALGALLALSSRPWFAGAALEDQQLGGLLMWVPAGALLTAIALALLAGWLRAGRGAPVSRLGTLLVALAALGTLSACNAASSTATAMAGGDPDRGRDALRTNGCVTCHTIPGVRGAVGTVGPPLSRFARRSYAAGAPNDPDHVVRFIQHPRQVRPGTPMPDMGLSDRDARDMAAYLYTLR
jgi:cytochrome c oxidase assembly factor CtaG